MDRPEYKPMNVPPRQKTREEVSAEASAAFEKTIMKFIALMEKKKLDKNKSVREIEQENALFKQLIDGARRVELVDIGKGTIGLSIVALRASMFVNNRINELEAEVVRLCELIAKLGGDDEKDE